MTPFNPLSDAEDRDTDDIALVRRVQSGDRDALEALVVRHQDWIYNIVVRMVYHPHDAEDATQEVLIKLLTNERQRTRTSDSRLHRASRRAITKPSPAVAGRKAVGTS